MAHARPNSRKNNYPNLGYGNRKNNHFEKKNQQNVSISFFYMNFYVEPYKMLTFLQISKYNEKCIPIMPGHQWCIRSYYYIITY